VAVRIRLKKLGRKKKPVYRVVVANVTSPRDGRIIEEVGFYDPAAEPRIFTYKKDRVEYWLGNGAQPSDPVQRLFSEEGIVEKRKHVSKNPGLSKKEVKRIAEEGPAEKEEAPKAEKVEAPVEETPKAEKAEAPLEEVLKAEKAETPVEEAPKVEKVEAPVEETPKSEAPSAE
jgi:small subunit ribosomal protein S16